MSKFFKITARKRFTKKKALKLRKSLYPKTTKNEKYPAAPGPLELSMSYEMRLFGIHYTLFKSILQE
jgi:hypothetical protein